VSAPIRYALVGAAGVAAVTLGVWPFLGAEGRRGVLVAGVIALTVQSLTFWTLLRYRGQVRAFLAVWAGGTAVRMLVIVAVAAIAIRRDLPGTVPMLLALAGFFFGLLLLEPVYFRARAGETT
jgi:hypothetical protein